MVHVQVMLDDVLLNDDSDKVVTMCLLMMAEMDYPLMIVVMNQSAH